MLLIRSYTDIVDDRRALRDYLHNVFPGAIRHQDVLVGPAFIIQSDIHTGVAFPIGRPGAEGDVASARLALLRVAVAELVDRLVAQRIYHGMALGFTQLVECFIALRSTCAIVIVIGWDVTKLIIRPNNYRHFGVILITRIRGRDIRSKSVAVIQTLDEVLHVLAAGGGVGVVVADLGQGDVHDVLVAGHQHLLGTGQACLGGGHPTDFGHLDDAVGDFAVAGHHGDGGGLGGQHRAADGHCARPHGSLGLDIDLPARCQAQRPTGFNAPHTGDLDAAGRNQLHVAQRFQRAGDLDVAEGVELRLVVREHIDPAVDHNRIPRQTQRAVALH